MDASQRLLDAINTLNPASRGTLWLVKDEVWKQIIPRFVCKRKGHPGLSLGRKEKYRSLLDTVPMMIGTSKNHDGLRIDNAMPISSRKSCSTYFSILRPLMIVGKEEPFAVKNFTGHSEFIQKNHDKPRLDADEMFRLEAYLFGKGIQ